MPLSVSVQSPQSQTYAMRDFQLNYSVSGFVDSCHYTLNSNNTLLLLHADESTTGVEWETPVNSSGVTYDTGKYNSSMLLDTGDYLTYNTSGNINLQKGLISLWVKPSWVMGSEQSRHVFFELGGSAVSYYSYLAVEKPLNTNIVRFTVRAGTGSLAYVNTSSLSWSAGSWHHIAAAYNASEIRLYVDGSLAESKSISGIKNLLPQPSTFSVGQAKDGSSPASSTIDDFWISNNTESAEIVRVVYQSTNPVAFKTTLAGCSNTTFNASEGLHNIVVYANDTYGNSQGFGVSFSVAVPPVITLITPEDALEIPDYNITFYYNVSDDSSIANCTFYLNGTANRTIAGVAKDTTLNFTYNISDGNYSWQVKCFDSQGVEGSSETRILRNTNAAPIVPDIDSMSSILGPFLATNTTTGHQLYSDVAIDENTGIVYVTWQDSRHGSYDIFLKMFNASDGSAVRNDTRITTTGYTQQYPRIAVNNQSDIGVMVWEDYKAGNGDIYYQRFNATTGALIGNNTAAVSDSNIDKYPDVAINAMGDTAVVSWYQLNSNTKSNDVFAKTVNLSSGSVSPVIEVSAGKHDQINPKIGVQDDLAIIVYEDYRDGFNGYIYYQLFNLSSATLIGGNTNITTTSTVALDNWYQLTPKHNVLVEQGVAYIVWDNYNYIYFRAFNMTSRSLMPREVVLASGSNSRYGSIDVDVQRGVGFLSFSRWGVAGDYSWNMYALKFNLTSLSRIGGIHTLSDAQSTQFFGEIVYYPERERIFAAWSDYRSGRDYDIYGKVVNTVETQGWVEYILGTIGFNAKSNATDLDGWWDITSCRIRTRLEGGAFTVKEGVMSSGTCTANVTPADGYPQHRVIEVKTEFTDTASHTVNSSAYYGTLKGSLYAPQFNNTPYITPNPSYGIDNMQCNARNFYDADGNSPGTFRYRWFINGNLSTVRYYYLRYEYRRTGGSVLCEVTPVDEYGIAGAPLNSSAVVVQNSPPVVTGYEYIVNNSLTSRISPLLLTTNTRDQINPTISGDPGRGIALIVWSDYRNLKYDIYAQRMNLTSGSKIGSEFVVFNNSNHKSSPYVEVDTANGNAVVVWHEAVGTDRYIYGRLINLDNGTAAGEVINISIRTGVVDTKPVVGVYNTTHTAVVVFQGDLNYTYDIRAQRVSTANGSLIGEPITLIIDQFGQTQPNVEIGSDGMGFIAWIDGRNETTGRNFNILMVKINMSKDNITDSQVFMPARLDSSSPYFSAPSIGFQGENGYLSYSIPYMDYDVFATRFNTTSLNSIGPRVNITLMSWAQYSQTMGVNENTGIGVIGWHGSYGWQNYGIFMHRLNMTSGRLLENVKEIIPLTSSTSTFKYNPKVFVDSQRNNAMFTWYDYYYGNANIYSNLVKLSSNEVSYRNASAHTVEISSKAIDADGYDDIRQCTLYYKLASSPSYSTKRASYDNTTGTCAVNLTSREVSGSSEDLNVMMEFNDTSSYDRSEVRTIPGIQNSAPGVSLTQPASGLVNGSVAITIASSDADGDSLNISIHYSTDNGVSWNKLTEGTDLTSATWDTTIFPDGNYKLRAFADDLYGKTNYSTSGTLQVRNTANNPPEVTVAYPNGGESVGGVVNATWTLTDAENSTLAVSAYYTTDNETWIEFASGENITNYLWDTIVLDQSAQYLIKASAFDGTAITEDTSDSVFTLDNVPPVVTLQSPENGSTQGHDVNFTYSVSDASDIANCRLIIDNAVSQTDASITKDVEQYFTTTLSNGVYQWQVNCTDSSSGAYSSGSETRTIEVYENNAPQIALHYPENSVQNNNTQSMSFNYTATDDVATSLTCILHLDGVLAGVDYSAESGAVSTFELSELGYAAHTWYVNCTDGLTYSVSATRTFTLAYTQLPTVEIVSPSNNSWNSPQVLLYTTITDDPNVSIDACWYSLDSSANQTFDCESKTMEIQDGGIHQITVYANNTYGNTGQQQAVFYVDSTQPSVSLITPGSATQYNDGDVLTFTCDISDGVYSGGLANVTFYASWGTGWHLNETAYISGTTNTTSFTKTLSTGGYTWTCQAYDRMGLNGTTVNRTLTVIYTPGGGGTSPSEATTRATTTTGATTTTIATSTTTFTQETTSTQETTTTEETTTTSSESSTTTTTSTSTSTTSTTSTTTTTSTTLLCGEDIYIDCVCSEACGDEFIYYEPFAVCSSNICCCRTFVSHPGQGTDPPSCHDSVRNNGEIGVDCGGPCPPCPTTATTLAPDNPIVSCGDSVQNYGELGVDCGGPCPSCPSCSNRIQDQGEAGVDCGGPCIQCSLIPVTPKLDLEGPTNIIIGENVTYCVLSDGKSVQALISIVYADGSIEQVFTNQNGCINMYVNTSGIINITASKLGYKPGVVEVSIWGRIAPVIAVVASSMLSLMLVASAGYVVFLLPKRIIISASSLKTLLELDMLGKYKTLYVTERVYNSIPELPADKIKMVKLSPQETDEANKMAEEYGITIEDAETITLGKKLHAKKTIIPNMPENLKQKYKNIKDN